MRETNLIPTILFPQVSLAEEINSALPLEHTDVSAQVTGPIAVVTVAQRFANPLQEPAELDYLFPLPEDAAVTAFELRIGSRVIHGDLRELEAARESYEAARREGRRAGLLEQRRPNLFAVRLTGVRPGEAIDAVLAYQLRLKFEDGVYEFVFPMGITPKYDSPRHPHEGQGVQAPLAGASEKIGPVEVRVVVDAGAPIEGDPTSPSHPLEVSRLGEGRFEARPAGNQIPDRDFVLRYSLAPGAVRAAAWTSRVDGSLVFLASLLPPPLEDEPQSLPREFVFVLDRSGSMSGEPIRQARNALRACLRAAGPEDTVRILLFDNHLEWYRSEPFRLAQRELEQADAFLSGVEGRGGTEITGAVQAALRLPADPARQRFVVFLTDGAVSAEERVLDLVRSQLGQARVFTFGIGPSVNRALLSRMARLGRGRAEFLQLDEDIEGAIIRFQDSISFPALTGLELHWENGQAWDIYPAQLPDLFSGQPIEISGFIRPTGGPLRLTVRGKRGGQQVSLAIDLPEPADPAAGKAVERVWARARVEDLLERMELEPSKAAKLRAEILGLAIEHHLVTELTAFVAVDSTPGDASVPQRLVHVSQPLPRGLNRAGFEGQPPHLMQAASFLPAVPPPTSSAPGAPGILRSLSRPSMLSKGPSSGRRAGESEIYDAADRSYGADAVEFQDQRKSPDGESLLRLLVRSQQADGSWEGDAEQTAAALLAFIRAGHTTRAGSYRRALRRSIQWLKDSSLGGLAAFLRARVLDELSQATGDQGDRQAAQEARQALAQPSGPLEAAALDGSGAPPSKIESLDDLRLAALLKVRLPAPPGLLKGKTAGLALAWAAAVETI